MIKKKEMVMDRSCTDILCCFLFGIFLAAMVFVTLFAVETGDPNRILTPFDSDGNECGQPLQTATVGLGSRDFSEYRYKYFTSVMQAATGSKGGVYDAVCVKSCPKNVGSISQMNTGGVVKVDCLANSVIKACPDSFYNTTQLLGYCLPEASSTLSTIKDIGEEMNQGDSFATTVVDLDRSVTLIGVMLVVISVSTVLYVWVLKFIAKPLLYLSLVFLVLGLAGVGGYAWVDKDNFATGSQEMKIRLAISFITWIVSILLAIFICC